MWCSQEHIVQEQAKQFQCTYPENGGGGRVWKIQLEKKAKPMMPDKIRHTKLKQNVSNDSQQGKYLRKETYITGLKMSLEVIILIKYLFWKKFRSCLWWSLLNV